MALAPDTKQLGAVACGASVITTSDEDDATCDCTGDAHAEADVETESDEAVTLELLCESRVD